MTYRIRSGWSFTRRLIQALSFSSCFGEGFIRFPWGISLCNCRNYCAILRSVEVYNQRDPLAKAWVTEILPKVSTTFALRGSKTDRTAMAIDLSSVLHRQANHSFSRIVTGHGTNWLWKTFNLSYSIGLNDLNGSLSMRKNTRQIDIKRSSESSSHGETEEKSGIFWTLCIWAARFWTGRISVKDDERPGKTSPDNFSTAVSGYFERNLYVSCHEIVKELFISKTTILLALGEMGFRFFIAMQMLQELSIELKAKRVKICKEMLEILKGLDLRQKNHIITGDECEIYWDNYYRGQCTANLGVVSPRIHTMIRSEKYIFNLFHLPRIHFYRSTSEKRSIQFWLLYLNNSSKYRWNREYISSENTDSRLLAAYRQC
jgi:hypothetical protein